MKPCSILARLQTGRKSRITSIYCETYSPNDAEGYFPDEAVKILANMHKTDNQSEHLNHCSHRLVRLIHKTALGRSFNRWADLEIWRCAD